MPSSSPATSQSSVLSSPSTPRRDYLLDGEPVNLKELLAVNDFEADVVVQIRNLASGQSMNLRGGTAGDCMLTRRPVEATP